jgi:ArsR family transcriptional regulator
MDLKHAALVFKALGDESRLKIVAELQKKELCACNLLEVLPISQSTLSHHMKILIESGLVEAKKEKKWTYYSLSKIGCEHALGLLQQVTTIDENYEIACLCDEKEQ